MIAVLEVAIVISASELTAVRRYYPEEMTPRLLKMLERFEDALKRAKEIEMEKRISIDVCLYQAVIYYKHLSKTNMEM